MATTPPAPSPKDPPQTEPVEAGVDRARRLAGDAFEWTRAETRELIVRYKKQSRFFKWRAWIVVVYALIAVTSVVMALPPRNSIDAYVIPSYETIRGRLQVRVENSSTKPWTNVRLVLDDTWVYERKELGAGANVMPIVDAFVKIKSPSQEHAPGSLQPKVLRVETDQGKYEVALFGEH